MELLLFMTTNYEMLMFVKVSHVTLCPLSLSVQAQYEFVHKAVLEFLDTFSDYQNFK